MNGAGPHPRDVVKCRACSVDVVFLRTKAGRRMPVNVMPTDAKFRGPNAGETDYQYNVHQSHFQTCPDSPAFRERKTHAPQFGPRNSRDDWPPRAA